MGRQVVGYLRRHHVALLALVVAMGGTAYAVETNSIRSKHIVNGQVRSPDVGRGQIRTAHVRDDDLSGGGLAAEDVANDSLTGLDVADDSLTGADVTNESLTGWDVAFNQIEGSDINEETMGTVPYAAQGGTARSGTRGSCDPESGTYVDCASLSLTLPRAGRVLALGAVTATDEVGSDDYFGVCRLTIDGQAFGSDPGFLDTDSFHSGTLVGVTSPLAAGAHTLKMQCNQYSGGAIEYFDAQLWAVIVSAN